MPSALKGLILIFVCIPADFYWNYYTDNTMLQSVMFYVNIRLPHKINILLLENLMAGNQSSLQSNVTKL